MGDGEGGHQLVYVNIYEYVKHPLKWVMTEIERGGGLSFPIPVFGKEKYGKTILIM